MYICTYIHPRILDKISLVLTSLGDGNARARRSAQVQAMVRICRWVCVNKRKVFADEGCKAMAQGSTILNKVSQ